MLSKDCLELFDKVMSTIDSFQQDNGVCRFYATMQSYAENHRIDVRITYHWKVISFVVDELNKDHLYEVFEMKINELTKFENLPTI